MGCAMIFASNGSIVPDNVWERRILDPAPAQQEARGEALALDPPNP